VVICNACPKHVKTYLRCVMCKITIHVGCADSGGHTIYSWTDNWKCSLCSNKHTYVLGADAVGPAPKTSLHPLAKYIYIHTPPPSPPPPSPPHAARSCSSHAREIWPSARSSESQCVRTKQTEKV
jgi:hypothetical protein